MPVVAGLTPSCPETARTDAETRVHQRAVGEILRSHRLVLPLTLLLSARRCRFLLSFQHDRGSVPVGPSAHHCSSSTSLQGPTRRCRRPALPFSAGRPSCGRLKNRSSSTVSPSTR